MHSKKFPLVDVMTEFGAGPLWLTRSDKEARVYVEPSELPLSPPLVAALQSWQAEYDATLDQNYPPDSIPPNKEFWVKGKELTERLRAELGDSYAVEYTHSKELG